MNSFKIENNNLIINDIDDIRYLNGEFSINDWINNLDKIGKELQFGLGFKAKVELIKKTKLLTDGKKYPDDFSNVIKKLSDNYVKLFDKTLKNIETYLDKLKEKKTNENKIKIIQYNLYFCSFKFIFINIDISFFNFSFASSKVISVILKGLPILVTKFLLLNL